MRDLIVHRREGKSISENAEFIKSNEVCFAEAQRENKGSYFIVLTATDAEYIHYVKNANSFVDLISTLDGFVKIDRGRVANLMHKIEYNKEIGRLIYKSIKHKGPNHITVAKSYEDRFLKALKELGK